MNIHLLNICWNQRYEAIDILGHEALYSDNGFVAVSGQINACHIYWLRGGLDDDPMTPAAVEDMPVHVNFCGCVLTDEDLGINHEVGYLKLGAEDIGYLGKEVTIQEFLLRNEDAGEEGSGRSRWEGFKWED